MAAISPYFTENEAARYCRCGTARLRTWVDRGHLSIRTDVDGRRFFRREELDRVMAGEAEGAPPPARGLPAPPKAHPARKAPPVRSEPASRTPSGGLALPYTDPDEDTKKRARRGSK